MYVMVICGNGNFSENRYLYAYVIKKCSLWTLRFPNVDGGMRGHGEKPQIIVKLAVGRPDSGRKNMKKIGNQDTFVRDAVHGYTTSLYFVATLRAFVKKVCCLDGWSLVDHEGCSCGPMNSFVVIRIKLDKECKIELVSNSPRSWITLGWLQIYSGRLGVTVVDLCYFALFEDFSL